MLVPIKCQVVLSTQKVVTCSVSLVSGHGVQLKPFPLVERGWYCLLSFSCILILNTFCRPFHIVRMVTVSTISKCRTALLMGYIQDSEEQEFPFLREVFTPRDAHKVEYAVLEFLLLWVIHRGSLLTKYIVALFSCMVLTLEDIMIIRSKHGPMQIANFGQQSFWQRTFPMLGSLCMATTRASHILRL